MFQAFVLQVHLLKGLKSMDRSCFPVLEESTLLSETTYATGEKNTPEALAKAWE